MTIFNHAISGYENVKADKYIGIFGNPIKHTLSPVIHDNLSNQLGIEERYIPFHITENLGDAVKLAYDEGILGLNITVPYKQEVMEYLADIDEAAKVIGAVNTLVRCENGYKGYNTDMPGLAKALFSEEIALEGSSVIMLGAGGAARAVAYMCLKYGAKKVYIVNRTYNNAKLIADDMNKIFSDSLDEKIIPVAASDYKLIPQGEYIFIQCTSVGLHEGDGLPIVDDEEFYKMAYAGVDLIYNPAKTPFLKLMESLGKKSVNGLKMLLYQGIMAYELWNNTNINEDLADEVFRKLEEAVYGVKNHFERADNIILTGYMGAGKSAVGQALAQKLKCSFIDTDQCIVDREGMSINDIFKLKGESYFRDLETETIKALMESTNSAVISTGGGLPMREENSQLLRRLGRVYYLKANADTTYKRVSGNNDRPLLAGDNMYEKICKMLSERTPKYEKGCHMIIDTDCMTIDEIVNVIVG